jgi:hypothetical protein
VAAAARSVVELSRCSLLPSLSPTDERATLAFACVLLGARLFFPPAPDVFVAAASHVSSASSRSHFFEHRSSPELSRCSTLSSTFETLPLFGAALLFVRLFEAAVGLEVVVFVFTMVVRITVPLFKTMDYADERKLVVFFGIDCCSIRHENTKNCRSSLQLGSPLTPHFF